MKLLREYKRQSISRLQPGKLWCFLPENIEENGRSFAYWNVPEETLHVPLSHVAYVADEASDIPCFSLINGEGEIAIVAPPVRGSTPAHRPHPMRTAIILNYSFLSFNTES